MLNDLVKYCSTPATAVVVLAHALVVTVIVGSAEEAVHKRVAVVLVNEVANLPPRSFGCAVALILGTAVFRHAIVPSLRPVRAQPRYSPCLCDVSTLA